jgi:hypothetical protein
MVRCREGPERELYSLSVHRHKVLTSRRLKARMPTMRSKGSSRRRRLDNSMLFQEGFRRKFGCVEELSWKCQERSKDHFGRGDSSVLLRSGPYAKEDPW